MRDWSNAPWYEGSLTQQMDRDIIAMDQRAAERRIRHAQLRVQPIPVHRLSEETRKELILQEQNR